MAECMILRRGGLEYGDLACQPTNFTATGGILTANLHWALPVGDPQYAGVRICRREGAAPVSPEDGVLYEGGGNAYTDTGLTLGRTYYYRAFACNKEGLYQTARCVASVTAADVISLGNVLPGQEVQLKESGAWQTYLVVHQGYPAAGNGRTLLLRKDIQTLRLFSSKIKNEYAGGLVDTGCTALLGKLDAEVQQLVAEVELAYTTGEPHTLQKLGRKVFVLSATEVGLDTGIKANREGFTLPLLADHPELLIAIYRNTATNWWLRTPDLTTDSQVFYVNTTGALALEAANKSLGLRPALTLPSNGPSVDADGHIIV